MRWFVLLLLLLSSIMADDIPQKKMVIVTVPKAGTNLIKKAVEKLTDKKVQWIRTSKYTAADLETFLLGSKNNYFITHLFSESDPILSLNPDKFNKVLLVRDPRDVMVSFVYHITQKGRWPFTPKYDQRSFKEMAFDQQLATALQFPKFSPGDSLPIAAKWANNGKFTVIRFEDLVGSKGGGSDRAQIQSLYTLANCAGITLDSTRLVTVKDNLFGGTWTFRKGQIGEWAMSYNAQNKELFKMLFGQATVDLGYEKGLNW